ncbi:hypothetical protein [Nostoc sp.]|uniref:hypothetical protein n=1 Tax=Nostoc sp. TaxID=1180 RepID=UPI002FFA2CA1
MIRRPLAEVRMRLRLAMNFQIYGISDQYSFHDATAPDAIAILKALKCHSCSHQKLRFTSIRQQSRNFRDCRQLNIATVPSLFKAFSKHSPNRENSLAESVIKIM